MKVEIVGTGHRKALAIIGADQHGCCFHAAHVPARSGGVPNNQKKIKNQRLLDTNVLADE